MRSVLRHLWKEWKRVASWIARVQTSIILGAIYFLVIGTIGIIAKLVRHDPLQKRGHPRESYWMARDHSSRKIEDFQRQF